MVLKKFRITRDRRYRGIPLGQVRAIYKNSRRKMRMRMRSRAPIARSIGFSTNIYPPQKYTKLAYYQNYVLTQTTGTSTTQQWRLNSLYDFDYTSAGHQPYYYDQMSEVYASYRVFAVRFHYSYTCVDGSDNPVDSQLVFRTTPDGTTPTATAAGFQVECERPGALYKVYAEGGDPVTGVLTFRPYAILGMSKTAYNAADSTFAPVGGNPSRVPYLNFLPLSTAADAIHVLRVRAVFYCKFFDRKIVSGS